MTKELDIAFVSLSAVTLAGASFVPSLLDAPAVAQLLYVVAVPTRHRTTDDASPTGTAPWSPPTPSTTCGEKNPNASAVPGLVQQAH